MAKRQDIIYLGIIAALITLPSAGSLSYYLITQDPSMRPLGITQESLRAFTGQSADLEIVAIVDWDAGRSGQVTRLEMQTALIKVFKTKGVNVRVYFGESQNGTFVTYKIAASTIGPFTQSRAAEGISAAIAAYRMHVPYEP